jgi:hypothetical protein
VEVSVASGDSVELQWVLRPDPAGHLAQHDGKRVHGISRSPAGDGTVDVVLADGAHVRVHPRDLHAE